MSKEDLKVSIIVPNNGRDITLLRRSIDASTYRNTELIVIDRGFERSAQRNIGIRESTGECLLFLDSDQSVSPRLIAECVELVKLGYAAIYIPEIIMVRSFFDRVRRFEREFYTGTAIDVPRFVVRHNCPEFCEFLTGPEDADWGNRLKGYKKVSKNWLYHHDHVTVWEYLKKKAYYTKSMKMYAKLWKNDPVLNLKYRLITVFTENGKWKKLLRHPVLTLGIIFILLIRGVIYLGLRS